MFEMMMRRRLAAEYLTKRKPTDARKETEKRLMQLLCWVGMTVFEDSLTKLLMMKLKMKLKAMMMMMMMMMMTMMMIRNAEMMDWRKRVAMHSLCTDWFADSNSYPEL
jgi:hypothetical protein